MPASEADPLNLPPHARAADIKRAYRKAALGLHPDQNPHPDAARRFRVLTETYHRLLAAAPREPVRRAPEVAAVGVLADLRALVRRWTDEQWARPVDGLPALVWAVSVLSVLGSAWSYPTARPDVEGLREALEAWPTTLPPLSLSRREERRLVADLEAAAGRLDRLRAPKRGQRL